MLYHALLRSVIYIKESRKCTVCGRDNAPCTSRKYGALCAKHYQQLRKHGKFLDNIQRTTCDLNDYEIVGNTAIINLYDIKQNIVGTTMIDLDDLDRTIKLKWRLCENYVFYGNDKPIQLSYFILGITPKEGLVIDHINHNTLDNRKSNLRLTTYRVNAINKVIQGNNTSGIAGVWYDKSREKYCAEIKFNDIKCYLGRYKSFNDACYCRYLAELIIFKEFRSDNNDKVLIPAVNECNNKDKLKAYTTKRLIDKYDIA